VRHFLLSNCKYWMEEFHFDGFRFDGVTSMIYYNHGFMDFTGRDDFFGANVNRDAIVYLSLANRLIHDLHPGAIAIAEDVSGMPGMCFPLEDGGIGFDYRLGMALADFWIRYLKELPDEQWDIHEMWRMMTDRLPGVGTVAYAESHDQALVGDKTLAFRLMDREMYYAMDRGSQNPVVERGMALHKMIRLFTISSGGQAWLTFMGNEFGHPEWVDFPREGNDWSYAHARRQWSLADDPALRFGLLEAFDRAMVDLVRRNDIMGMGYAWNLKMDEECKTIVFAHGRFVFVFNWHPSLSVADYEIPVPEPGKYHAVLSTDAGQFGGFEREDSAAEHFSSPKPDGKGGFAHFIKIYNICRVATIYTILDS
jgi:1,4-alpha-glucan branching enzyme